MPTHRVAWIGAYEPLKPWRFDTGYPSISLFMGDDVDIYFRATMRAATTIYTPDGGFESTVVDLTYAKIIFTLTPADPDLTDPQTITKTSATGGGIVIVDGPTGQLTISLAAADTADLPTTVYTAECRALFTDTGKIGMIGKSPAFFIPTSIGADAFNAIP
jgi:hypothetical protein